MTYKIAVFFECGMYFMWITWLLCSAHRLGTIGLGALRSELGDGAERRRQRRRRRDERGAHVVLRVAQQAQLVQLPLHVRAAL